VSCNFCKYEELSKLGIQLSKDEFPEKRLDEWIKDREIKYYYALDDCLYC